MFVAVLTLWYILGAFALILLILFWSNKNAVWGGVTGGLILGVVVAFFGEDGFDWHFVAKSAIVGVLIGFVSELLGKLSERLKKQ